MLRNARILVVQANSILLSDLKELLERESYQIATAANGREALTRLASGLVDLVISDFEMPSMKGDMLRELLRSHPSTLRLPFILLSSGTPPSVDGDIAYGFLKKPVVIDELISSIEKLMARQAVSGQRAPD